MPEVRLIEDWREKWEPVNKHGEHVLAVWNTGKTLCFTAVDKAGQIYTNYDQGYLIPKAKPKTYRPWKREEVPVGSVVRDKHSAYVQLITSATESYIGMSSFVRSPRELFDSFVMHLTNPDGSWVPTEQCPKCGVEE